MVEEDDLAKIAADAIDRYSKRFEKFGIDPKSLGWGSRNDQSIRFGAAVLRVDFNNKSVLDIGCGFSDFYEFLIQYKQNIINYCGIDINKNFISVSKKRYPQNDYLLGDIFSYSQPKCKSDIVAMFGLLNYKLKVDNLAYSKKTIQKVWDYTNETLIVDFLSSHRTPEYPKEDFVYYHDPKDVLDICFDLTDDILLIHDYPPIPQKEFMVILKK